MKCRANLQVVNMASQLSYDLLSHLMHKVVHVPCLVAPHRPCELHPLCFPPPRHDLTFHASVLPLSGSLLCSPRAHVILHLNVPKLTWMVTPVLQHGLSFEGQKSFFIFSTSKKASQLGNSAKTVGQPLSKPLQTKTINGHGGSNSCWW